MFVDGDKCEREKCFQSQKKERLAIAWRGWPAGSQWQKMEREGNNSKLLIHKP